MKSIIELVVVIVPDSKDDPESGRVIEALENIDDDCDRNGIILVRNCRKTRFLSGLA